MLRATATAALVLLAACEAEAPATASSTLLSQEFELASAAVGDRVAELGWAAPSPCPQVYRVRVDETYPPGLAERLRTSAEHSESWLVLAACFERTWDPVEDALALGWARLPARLTAVGETWRGARVEARCNRSACVDPETRGGGPDNHGRPCTTMSWRERLDALYLLDGALVAEISSFWSDGHPLGDGIWSERSAVVSVDHGRLLHSRTAIHHGYTGIEREVRIDAVDACPGGLVAAGWSPEARLLAARDELLAELSAGRGTRTKNLPAADGR